jgi:hypothetical protein
MNTAAIPARPLRWFEYALAFAPLPLAFTGAIGLAIGPAACALNLLVMRSPASLAVKIAAALAIAALAVFAWGLATRLMI